MALFLFCFYHSLAAEEEKDSLHPVFRALRGLLRVLSSRSRQKQRKEALFSSERERKTARMRESEKDSKNENEKSGLSH